MKHERSGSGGIGVGGVLLVVFVVLKLCGIISWSWWWVLSPALIAAAVVAPLLLLAAVLHRQNERELRRYVESRRGRGVR